MQAFRQQPALQHLASSQWGAVRGVLLDHGREPFAALSEHFRNQRAKAEKKGDLRGLAAFDSLGGMLGEIRILASSELEQQGDRLVIALGPEFNREKFSRAFERAAIEGFLISLIRLLKISEELKVCLTV